MIYLGVSGAHGVGKSTVISILEDRFQSTIHTVKKVAQTVQSKGVKLGKEADVDSYVFLLSAYFAAKTDAEKSNRTICVFDRTMLDTFSYAMVNMTMGVKVKDHVIDLLKSVWVHEQAQFSHYFFVPVEFPEKSPKAATDEVYRSLVSDQIENNLLLSGIKHTKLCGDPTERASTIISVVSEILNSTSD